MAEDTRSLGTGLIVSIAIVLTASVAARWYFDHEMAQNQQTEQVAVLKH